MSKSELTPNLAKAMAEMSERYDNLTELPKELPESFRERKIIFLFDEISFGQFMDSQPSLELSDTPRVLNPAAFAIAASAPKFSLGKPGQGAGYARSYPGRGVATERPQVAA